MSTIFECPECKYDFDADRGAVCPHCDRPDLDAAVYFRDRIRERLGPICHDADAGGLSLLDVEHMCADAWPTKETGC